MLDIFLTQLMICGNVRTAMVDISGWRDSLSIEKVIAGGFVKFFAPTLGYLILFIIARTIYNLECDLSLTLIKLFRPRSGMTPEKFYLYLDPTDLLIHVQFSNLKNLKE